MNALNSTFRSFFNSVSGYSIFASAFIVFIFLTLIINKLKINKHPLAETLKATRDLLVPSAAILYYLLFVLELDISSPIIKVCQTVLGIEIIWILLTLVKVFLFSKSVGSNWRSRIPGLLVDIIRFAMVIIGTAFVVAGIWNKDLGGFLATLGIGSIVLGLALQDTLGSLMAGIALVIERPFTEGEWIRVGDLEGKVSEVNWRSVRLINRQNDVVIVPNSVLGKERIENLSRPTKVHAQLKYVGFSYEDPPNKAKDVLLKTALATPRILSSPPPAIRTKEYQDFSILYEIKFFISDLDNLQDIEGDLMTNIWYAAKRNGLVIPFPIRTVHKTEIPYAPKTPSPPDLPGEIRKVPIFQSISDEELDIISQRAKVKYFAKGEIVVKQNDKGDSMFIICQGHASVSVKDQNSAVTQVAVLSPGNFFGEMSALSGESRTATVAATDDLELVIIDSITLKVLLDKHPQLAEKFSEIMENRKIELNELDINVPVLESANTQEKNVAIIDRIKKFFSI